MKLSKEEEYAILVLRMQDKANEIEENLKNTLEKDDDESYKIDNIIGNFIEAEKMFKNCSNDFIDFANRHNIFTHYIKNEEIETIKRKNKNIRVRICEKIKMKLAELCKPLNYDLYEVCLDKRELDEFIDELEFKEKEDE